MQLHKFIRRSYIQKWFLSTDRLSRSFLICKIIVSNLHFKIFLSLFYPTSVDRYLIRHYHCCSAIQHYIQRLYSRKHGCRIRSSFAVRVHHQQLSNTNTISTLSHSHSQNRTNSSSEVSHAGSRGLPRFIRKLSVAPQLHLRSAFRHQPGEFRQQCDK